MESFSKRLSATRPPCFLGWPLNWQCWLRLWSWSTFSIACCAEFARCRSQLQQIHCTHQSWPLFLHRLRYLMRKMHQLYIDMLFSAKRTRYAYQLWLISGSSANLIILLIKKSTQQILRHIHTVLIFLIMHCITIAGNMEHSLVTFNFLIAIVFFSTSMKALFAVLKHRTLTLTICSSNASCHCFSNYGNPLFRQIFI